VILDERLEAIAYASAGGSHKIIIPESGVLWAGENQGKCCCRDLKMEINGMIFSYSACNHP